MPTDLPSLLWPISSQHKVVNLDHFHSLLLVKRIYISLTIGAIFFIFFFLVTKSLVSSFKVFDFRKRL